MSTSMFGLSLASSSWSICFPSFRSPRAQAQKLRLRIASRPFSSGTQSAARQALARITPKRIAVPIPPGSRAGADPSVPRPSIWRPIVFCLVFGGGTFIAAAHYTNVDTARWVERLGGGRTGSWWGTSHRVSAGEIVMAKQQEGVKHAQAVVNELPRTLSFLPNFLLVPILRGYVTVKEYSLNNLEANVLPKQMAAGMAVILLAWRVKSLEPFMRRWFLHHPILFSGSVKREWQNCVTLFTSTLSHQAFPHFFFNSFALISFGSAAFAFLPAPPRNTEESLASTYVPHYLAFFTAAGLFSSLSSHLWTNLVRLPRLLRALASPARLSSAQALAYHQGILPSLGASGAIYAALVVAACQFPDLKVGIILVPFITFPIWVGIGGMVTLDLAGLIMGWQLFDHVAHLGGAAFGLLYYAFGWDAWLWLRRKLKEVTGHSY